MTVSKHNEENETDKTMTITINLPENIALN